MPYVWVEPTVCTTQRDCDCCGASAAKWCVAQAGHDGGHHLECRRCGRDIDCL